MSVHKEISFEDEICAHLGANGWLYEANAAAADDRARALYPPDLLAWVQTTQPKAWEVLNKTYGAAAEADLLDRVRKQLDDRGAFDVLRYGVEIVGLRQSLSLAQFKPALSMNAEVLARYSANRLRVVRQVRYSTANDNSIDLVLFLNGVPVATAELKTDFTQAVQDAIDQYRFDRNPRPKGEHGRAAPDVSRRRACQAAWRRRRFAWPGRTVRRHPTQRQWRGSHVWYRPRNRDPHARPGIASASPRNDGPDGSAARGERVCAII